jgi:hypothetical protein
MQYKGMPKATPADFERMDRLREMDCMCCALKGDLPSKRVEIHHVKQGNKRLGHLYTIPLCAAHHRGERGEHGTKEISVHGSGMKAFRKRWGYDDLQLWQKLQVMLGLDDSPPPTNIIKRRLPRHMSEAQRVTTGD